MRFNFNIISIFIFSLFLYSCTSVPKEYTPSGMAEVTIYAPYDDVKGHLIQSAQLKGWSIVSDNNFQTRFTKPCGQAFQCAMVKAFIGNTYSTTPNLEFTYQYMRVNNGVKVIVSSYEATTQMAFGQINRANLLNNNETFNATLSNLKQHKSKIEGMASK